MAQAVSPIDQEHFRVRFVLCDSRPYRFGSRITHHVSRITNRE